jgi:predicted DNA-binding WGR domain protein
MTASAAAPRIATERVAFQYKVRSEVGTEKDGSSVLLALDGGRGAASLRGSLRDGALFRDAFMTAVAIWKSDLRYRGRDRAAYLAYLMKQGKKANAQIWEAQKQFLDAQFSDDVKTEGVLDPLLTVERDQVSLEVFSGDESAYARLSLASELFEGFAAQTGSTFVDLPDPLIERLDRLRTYLPVRLEAGVSVPSRQRGEARSVDVPHGWLRGFLQVQSAATLPAATCEIAPVDLYNLLFALRTRKAKKPPRGLRFELIPGLAPRLVIEPWELVLECHGPAYQGSTPRVVRTFGRQRLLALARALPHLRSAKVQLLGPGLPVFWVLDMGLAQLTVALTGWTESSWASAASFDQLMPHANRGAGLEDLARGLLRTKGPLSLAQLSGELQASREESRAALQRECLRGRVLFDVAGGVYRARDLLAQPVSDEAIRFGSAREARAHRLLGDGTSASMGEVTVTKLHEVAGEGVEIHGEVVDKEARRSYGPHFSMDLEGRVSDAFCSCSTFQRSGMREGPCEHMIALRLAYGRKVAEAEALRQTPEGRKTIRAETRTFVRRDARGSEVVYRVSLDDKVVHVQWGARAVEPRHQHVLFDNDAQAKEAYFSRLEALASDGFIDTDAASGLRPGRHGVPAGLVAR